LTICMKTFTFVQVKFNHKDVLDEPEFINEVFSSAPSTHTAGTRAGTGFMGRNLSAKKDSGRGGILVGP